VLFKEEFIMSIKIGNLQVELPIIQGGMAIRASMARLAAAVANEGGIGLIAGTALSTEELKDEIKKARELIKKKGGALGVNIMFAANNFVDLVKASINAGADLIVFGAGFSRDVFELGKESGVPIVPIVSSLKLAKISERLGASAIIVEGGNAGGHLGTNLDSWDIVGEIAEKISVPVFGAGGVITPDDARRMLALGADGIQMGSRFIASDECEVSDEFKQMYINSKEGDIVEIMSSAGLPANAIISPYVEKVLNKKTERPKSCTGCLKKCTMTFCVNERLVKGHEGDYEEGIFFAGKDAWKIEEILSVEDIMKKFKEVF
jgi:NAD(P)H-dependent flavin oxidoreductase YrpB (nitropropane dioxygenase family)